jgi:predicted Zn-dependent protease
MITAAGGVSTQSQRQWLFAFPIPRAFCHVGRVSDEFENGEQAKRRWRLIGMAVVLFAVVAAVAHFVGRPAYRHFKETRSLKQARSFLDKRDVRNAVLSLKAALAANASNLEATRLMADLLTQAQSPAAIGWWRRVVELAPTTEHRVGLAAAALRVEKSPYPVSTQTLDELAAGGADTNTAYHLVASQVALRLNRPEQAAQHLEAAARLEPTNRLHQLNLATLRLRQPAAAAADAARRELAALVADPVLGEHALRSLITDHLVGRRFDEAERISKQLLASPQARFEDRLQHLSVLAAVGSPQTNVWLTQVQNEAATNLTKIVLVAGWQTSRDQAREALNWMARLDPQLRSSLPVPLLEAECHLALKDWAGLEQFLSEQNWEEQEAMRLALLARAMRELGRRDLADRQWRRVLDAPGSKGELLGAVAQMVAAWGWQQESEEALWALLKRAPWQDWAWQALIRARRETGDTAGLYRVFSAMLEKKPQDLVVKNNVAALGLLLNRDTEKCARLAREVYAAGTTNATFVSTHAFALHLQGQSAEGLRLLQALPEKELQRPSVAGYHAILLAATGQRNQAMPVAALAGKGRLLPEEKRLLEAVQAAN